LTLARARPVRVLKTKPPVRRASRPIPPSPACTTLRSAPNPCHGNGRHRAETLERGGDPRLQRSHAQGLFAAFLFWQLHPSAKAGQISQFTGWVLRTHQYELRSINAADLIKIFEKIAESRKRQIFISMWFHPDTQANFDAIKAAIDDLNVAHQLDIQLREIRVDQFDTGYSYEINQEILDLIENSGLMIADLSGGNKNVHHEIGYLMGLNRGRGLRDENFLLVHNEAVGKPAADIGFNLAGIKQLRVKDTNTLREDVKRQIAIFYGLADGAVG
jgi:hypothetical protein